MKKTVRIQLKPNSQCKTCWGRGYITLVAYANTLKEVRPCHCVKALVKERPDGEIEQYIRYEYETKEDRIKLEEV